MKLLNQKGEIDYSKFLLSSKDAKLYLKKEKLIQAFKYFDVDNSWFIEKNDIKNVLSRNGNQIYNDNEIEIMMKEIKIKCNDKDNISLNDFLKLFDIYE